jgi:hypothetical protein
MNSDRTLTIQRIRELVDEYHNGSHPLPQLMELRREVVVMLFRLTSHIKASYGKKAHANIIRKYAFYREMLTAMDRDKAALGKALALNQYEVRTEAMDAVLQAKKAEAEAEAEWEEVKSVIDMGKQVLSALSQEIADFRHEKGHSQFLDQVQKQQQ